MNRRAKTKAQLLREIATLRQQVAEARTQGSTVRPTAESLDSATECFKLLLENITDYAIFLLDPAGYVTHWNSGAERLFGYTTAEILGQSGERIFVPEDIARGTVAQELHQAATTGRAEDERWHRRKDDSRFWGSGIVTALRDEQGHLRGFAKILRDLTTRKQTEAAVQESETRYRLLFEQTSDLVVFMTPEGKITQVNPAVEHLLGWTRATVIGQPYCVLFTAASAETVGEQCTHALAGAALLPLSDLDMVSATGQVIPVEGRLQCLRDATGTPVEIHTTYRDLTDRKTLERQRAQFIAMLVHDIRNPLSVVLGGTELLLEEAPQAGTLGADLQRIRNNALAVSSLVENYLHYTQIESGQVRVRREPVDVAAVLRRVQQHYAAEAARQDQTLRSAVASPPPLVLGDRMAVERICTNLVQNALKFTPRGGTITLRATGHERGVAVTVADTGPGIAAEDLPFMFEAYRRGAAAQHYPGMGLGLYIVKTLVEAQGGRVEISSTVGQGTSVTVVLPSVFQPTQAGPTEEA